MRSLQYRAPEIATASSEKEALLSSFAVFLAVKFSVRSSQVPQEAQIPAFLQEVLEANERLYVADTVLERHVARKGVLKFLSLEPSFPTLQELSEVVVHGATRLKPHEFLFEGEGMFEGEIVRFDHCRPTLGQRITWKFQHRLFWKLVQQLAEPNPEFGVSWLEVAAIFADHQWLYKLIESKLFPIDRPVLCSLSKRILAYTPGCVNIDPADVYALPAWNECGWPDGRILFDLLGRGNDEQLQRVLPLLLRLSSEFGFGSPAIFKVLVAKASSGLLEACAEDLLVRLIRDSFFDDSLQSFRSFALSRILVGSSNLGHVSSFDPAMVRAQVEKLSIFVAELKKRDLDVRWNYCLGFCNRHGDVARSKIIQEVCGVSGGGKFESVSGLMNHTLLLSLLVLYVFCLVWSAPFSFQKIGKERCAWLLGSSFGLYCLSLFLWILELLPGVARWCARLACIAPFYISFFSSGWLLLTLSCCHVFLVSLFEEQFTEFFWRDCSRWLLIVSGPFSVRLQGLSNRNLCVLALGIFFFVEILCWLGLRKLVILWVANTLLTVSWLRAFGSRSYLIGRGLFALLLCTFFVFLFFFCFWIVLLIFNDLWIGTDATSFLVTVLISASVSLERWMLRQSGKRKAKGERNLAQITGLNY